MDPVTLGLGLGAVKTGLNVFGAIAGNRAEQQQYENEKAFQQANSVYAGWKATVDQAMAGANQEQAYWQQTVQYNQDLAYARSQRNVDLVRSINQADTVRQTRESAGGQFILSSEAIQQRLGEQAMADAVALQQYTVAALKNRASIRANPQAGASIDRLMNDFVRQEGDYRTITAINEGLRNRQYRREQAGAVAQYLSQYNSQAFYEAQPYLEPMAPFVPLPALLEPPPPTMTGAGPSGAAGALRIGTGLLEGAQFTMGAISRFKGMASSGKLNPFNGSTTRLAYGSGLNLMN
jgi:hypothetical protein